MWSVVISSKWECSLWEVQVSFDENKACNNLQGGGGVSPRQHGANQVKGILFFLPMHDHRVSTNMDG